MTFPEADRSGDSWVEGLQPTAVNNTSVAATNVSFHLSFSQEIEIFALVIVTGRIMFPSTIYCFDPDQRGVIYLANHDEAKSGNATPVHLLPSSPGHHS